MKGGVNLMKRQTGKSGESVILFEVTVSFIWSPVNAVISPLNTLTLWLSVSLKLTCHPVSSSFPFSTIYFNPMKGFSQWMSES